MHTKSRFKVHRGISFPSHLWHSIIRRIIRSYNERSFNSTMSIDTNFGRLRTLETKWRFASLAREKHEDGKRGGIVFALVITTSFVQLVSQFVAIPADRPSHCMQTTFCIGQSAMHISFVRIFPSPMLSKLKMDARARENINFQKYWFQIIVNNSRRPIQQRNIAALLRTSLPMFCAGKMRGKIE